MYSNCNTFYNTNFHCTQVRVFCHPYKKIRNAGFSHDNAFVLEYAIAIDVTNHHTKNHANISKTDYAMLPAVLVGVIISGENVYPFCT